MMDWKEDSDCCSWDGVTCDTVTGHVIGLDLSCSCLRGSMPSNSSLFLLSHLQKLNLAFNCFDDSQILSDIAQLKSLTHLNLSFSFSNVPIPLEISHLSKLVSLDLASDPYASLTFETHVMKGLVQNMTRLEELILDGVNLSNVPPGCLTNLSSSLTLLNLSGCQLQGSFPVNIFHLPSLHTLHLNSNDGLRLVLPKVNWSSALKDLDVSYTVLNLSYNQLEGPIPQGQQFNTFQNDSYIGNLGLCGLPLLKKCSNDEAPESKPTKFQKEQNTSSWFDWKIIMMGYGSGLVIGLSMGYVVLSTRKPWWFVSMVERKVLKLTERRKRERRRN